MSSFSGAVPKAMVSESNGEISASVDETNRIRAALGLKPLRMDNEGKGNNDKAKEKNIEEELAKLEEEERQKDIATKLTQSRLQRQQRAKLARVKTLGEADDEDDSSTAAWLAGSRQRTAANLKKEKERAAAKAKELAEQEAEQYDSAALSGMKLSMAANDIGEGESIIMTLKDSSVVSTKDGRRVLGEDEDELENVAIKEAYQRQVAERRKKGLPKYDATDDREFKEGGMEGDDDSLLPQYEDEKIGPKGIRLGEGGTLDTNKLKEEEVIEKRLQAQMSGKTLTDLSQSKAKEIREFYTKEEIASFKKPSKKRKKVKRRRTTMEVEFGAVGQAGEDFGSRRTMDDGENVHTLKEDEEDGKDKFERALQAAAAQSHALLSTGAGDVIGEDDDQEELAAALDRARQVAIAKQRAAAGADDDAVSVQTDEGEGEDQPGTANGGMVFTSTTEFVRNLRSADEVAADRQQAAQSRKRGRDDLEHAPEGADMEGEDSDGADSIVTDMPGKSQAQATKSVAESLLGSGNVQSSVAAALQFAKARNFGKDDRFSGRAKDDKVENGEIKDSVEMAFVRLDEYGRPMTQKEQWRKLNHRFHNIHPSLNKKEKEKERYEMESKAKRTAANDTPLAAMQKLRSVQQATGQHYLVRTGVKQHEVNNAKR